MQHRIYGFAPSNFHSSGFTDLFQRSPGVLFALCSAPKRLLFAWFGSPWHKILSLYRQKNTFICFIEYGPIFHQLVSAPGVIDNLTTFSQFFSCSVGICQPDFSVRVSCFRMSSSFGAVVVAAAVLLSFLVKIKKHF